MAETATTISLSNVIAENTALKLAVESLERQLAHNLTDKDKLVASFKASSSQYVKDNSLLRANIAQVRSQNEKLQAALLEKEQALQAAAVHLAAKDEELKYSRIEARHGHGRPQSPSPEQRRASAAITAVKSGMQEVARLQAINDALRLELHKARTDSCAEAIELRGIADNRAARLEVVRAQVAELREEVRAARVREIALEREKDALRQELDNRRHDITGLQTRLVRTEAQVAGAEERLDWRAEETASVQQGRDATEQRLRARLEKLYRHLHMIRYNLGDSSTGATRGGNQYQDQKNLSSTFGDYRTRRSGVEVLGEASASLRETMKRLDVLLAEHEFEQQMGGSVRWEADQDSLRDSLTEEDFGDVSRENSLDKSIDRSVGRPNDDLDLHPQSQRHTQSESPVKPQTHIDSPSRSQYSRDGSTDALHIRAREDGTGRSTDISHSVIRKIGRGGFADAPLTRTLETGSQPELTQQQWSTNEYSFTNNYQGDDDDSDSEFSGMSVQQLRARLGAYRIKDKKWRAHLQQLQQKHAMSLEGMATQQRHAEAEMMEDAQLLCAQVSRMEQRLSVLVSENSQLMKANQSLRLTSGSGNTIIAGGFGVEEEIKGGGVKEGDSVVELCSDDSEGEGDHNEHGKADKSEVEGWISEGGGVVSGAASGLERVVRSLRAVCTIGQSDGDMRDCYVNGNDGSMNAVVRVTKESLRRLLRRVKRENEEMGKKVSGLVTALEHARMEGERKEKEWEDRETGRSREMELLKSRCVRAEEGCVMAGAQAQHLKGELEAALGSVGTLQEREMELSTECCELRERCTRAEIDLEAALRSVDELQERERVWSTERGEWRDKCTHLEGDMSELQKQLEEVSVYARNARETELALAECVAERDQERWELSRCKDELTAVTTIVSRLEKEVKHPWGSRAHSRRNGNGPAQAAESMNALLSESQMSDDSIGAGSLAAVAERIASLQTRLTEAIESQALANAGLRESHDANRSRGSIRHSNDTTENISTTIDEYEEVRVSQVRITRLTARCRALEKQLQTMPRTLQVAQAEKRVLEAKLEQLNETCSARLKAQAVSAEQERGSLNSLVHLLTEEKESLQRQIQSQADTIHQLTQHINTLRVMELSKSLSSVHGTNRSNSGLRQGSTSYADIDDPLLAPWLDNYNDESRNNSHT